MKIKYDIICNRCKHKDTDQIGDIICTNKHCKYYNIFIEEETKQLKECDCFEKRLII